MKVNFKPSKGYVWVYALSYQTYVNVMGPLRVKCKILMIYVVLWKDIPIHTSIMEKVLSHRKDTKV